MKRKTKNEPGTILLQNNYGSKSVILKNYDKKKRFKRARRYRNPIEYQTYGRASKRENDTSTAKVDWEIMVVDLSEPQTSPFDEIIGDGPPHSNGDGSEVQ